MAVGVPFTDDELKLACDRRWLAALERTEEFKASQVSGATKTTARKFLERAEELGLVEKTERTGRGGTASYWIASTRGRALASAIRGSAAPPPLPARPGVAIVALIDGLAVDELGDSDLYVDLRKVVEGHSAGTTLVYRLSRLES